MHIGQLFMFIRKGSFFSITGEEVYTKEEALELRFTIVGRRCNDDSPQVNMMIQTKLTKRLFALCLHKRANRFFMFSYLCFTYILLFLINMFGVCI